MTLIFSAYNSKNGEEEGNKVLFGSVIITGEYKSKNNLENKSRLIVCDPLYEIGLFCDDLTCYNRETQNLELFNFQYGGCFILHDLSMKDWLFADGTLNMQNLQKKVTFWNPLMQTTKKNSENYRIYHQRTDVFDDKSSYLASLITGNPELGKGPKI